MTVDNEKLNPNIVGFVDYCDYQRVSGWLVDLSDVNRHLSLKVLIDGNEVCRGVADEYRQDLASHQKFNGTYHSYNLKIDGNFIDGKEHEIKIIEVETGYILQTTKQSKKIYSNSASYQSFDGINGDSNSFEKLKRLRLPSLEGKSVLDIGCNEGFFCNHAIKYGAIRVVGIDSNAEIINRAKERNSEAEFINTDWWNLPNEKFDVILFLSAIHYEKNQQKLLSHLQRYLKDKGTLILECGVSPENNANHWSEFQRHDGVFRYPNFHYLIDVLLSNYAVTPMGRSVYQSGDPVPRFVFHCSPYRSTALLIYGSPNSGKSVLAKILGQNQAENYSFDLLFQRLIENKDSPKNKLCEFIKKNGNVIKLDILSKKIIDAGLSSELVKLVMNEIPIESKIFIIEGEMLIYEEFRSELKNSLESNGIVVWNVTR
jgi:SAM-dependent methyltransferase